MRPRPRRQLLALLALAALSVWLSLHLPPGHAPGGPAAAAPHALRDRLLTFGFTLPLLGWLLGVLAAFVPYRGWPYRARLVTFALTASLAVQGLAAAWLVLRQLRG